MTMARRSAPMAGIIALLVITLAAITSAYSTPKPTQKFITQSTSSSSSPQQPIINRGTFLTTASTACLTFLSNQQPAFAAKEIDPALKGTKADPAFQGCLSECIYSCTKPKGMEQKSRAECLPECKKECATTKAQLLKGEPKKD
ncbi:hypothetical protein ACHAXR_012117 [Thalassiosira sp. AJA248-18]